MNPVTTTPVIGRGVYSASEAARLARVTPATVRRWFGPRGRW